MPQGKGATALGSGLRRARDAMATAGEADVAVYKCVRIHPGGGAGGLGVERQVLRRPSNRPTGA